MSLSCKDLETIHFYLKIMNKQIDIIFIKSSSTLIKIYLYREAKFGKLHTSVL